MQTHVACFDMAEYVPEQLLTEKSCALRLGNIFMHFSVLFFPLVITSFLLVNIKA